MIFQTRKGQRATHKGVCGQQVDERHRLDTWSSRLADGRVDDVSLQSVHKFGFIFIRHGGIAHFARASICGSHLGPFRC